MFSFFSSDQSHLDVHVTGQCADAEHAYSSKCQSLVKVVNPGDKLCMARAINMGLKYIECGEQRTPDFLAYCRNQQQQEQRDAAEALLSDAGIATDKLEYGIPEAKRIQQFLNNRYGEGQIRIVIFAHQLNNRVAWKGWSDKTSAHNLCLYHEANHFAFLGSPKQLLKV